MKKFFLSTILSAFLINVAVSQVTEKKQPVVRQKVTVKSEPAPPPPPPSSNKTTGTETNNAPVYTLTAVKVNIRTGNDNKEYPSGVRVGAGVKGVGMGYDFFLQE